MKLNSANLVIFISCLAGFLSVQRFYLADFYHYIPIVFILLAIASLVFDQRSLFSSFSLISLLTCVDNGGTIYNETPVLIRYLSYILCIFIFFLNKKILLKKSLIIYVGWLILILAMTLSNYENVVFIALTHNIIILFFVFVVFVFKPFSNKSLFHFHSILFPLSLGVILGELINITTEFELQQGYLNYNSIKSFIIYPSLYALCNRKKLLFILLMPFTLFIFIFYVTRMIVIAYILVIVVFLVDYLFKNFLKRLFVSFIFVSLIVFSTSQISFDDNELSKYKVTNMIKILFSDHSNDLSNVLKTLDPVRYGELIVLIDAPIINIIFGQGLGASYLDKNNIFGFVGKYDFAFSEQELESRRFYNFHDLWSDIGLRIGLLPLLILLVWLFKQYLILSFKSKESSIPLFSIVLLFCAFFSTAGIIFIFLLLDNIHKDNHLKIYRHYNV